MIRLPFALERFATVGPDVGFGVNYKEDAWPPLFARSIVRIWLLRFIICVRSYAMTSHEQRLWQELCLKAVMEPDPKKQTAIVLELNRVLQNRKKQKPRVNRVPTHRSV